MTRVRTGSATSIAPRTDSSASMFCGGTWVAGDGGIRRSGIDGVAAERGVRAGSAQMDNDQTKGGMRAGARQSQMPRKRNDVSVAETRRFRRVQRAEDPDAPRGRGGLFLLGDDRLDRGDVAIAEV